MESTTESYFENLEKTAWQKYQKARYLYHLTPVYSTEDAFAKMERITSDGLIARDVEDGKKPAIWFFVDSAWSRRVANSIMIQNFALFRVKKSEVPRHLLKWDNVAEIAVQVSFYAETDHVKNVECVAFYMPKPGME